jgi:cell division protein FtsZ
VDHEANIIVGATFDESLEGIIRVSVVATGIDMAGAPQASADARLAELAQKLRGPAQQQPAFQRPAMERAAPQPAPAPVLPAAATIEDVTIRPIAPKPKVYAEPPAQEAHAHHAEPEAFIPPQAERPQGRPRMPRVEELPLPAQNEIRAQRGQGGEEAAPVKQRRSLLQRLASVGLGRREEEADDHAEPRQATRPAARPQPVPAPRAQEPRMQEPVSEYGRRPAAPARPAPQGLDPHGRQAPVQAAGPLDDDQLEIPAFLRRQAN